jgi:hypothetical protein
MINGKLAVVLPAYNAQKTLQLLSGPSVAKGPARGRVLRARPPFMTLPGEDEHGFRAIAERSRLADVMNDSGAASMFLNLSSEWEDQANALSGWQTFRREDVKRLRTRYRRGLGCRRSRARAPDLTCPFANEILAVCRLG